MSVSFNEIFDRNSKIILAVMFGSILLMFFVLSKLGYFENQRRDNIVNEQYKGLVINKFLDQSNHNARRIKLSNGKEIDDYWPTEKEVEIKIGDSIIKEKMSTNIIVKRNSQIIYSINMLKEENFD